MRRNGFTNLIIGLTGNALDEDVRYFLAAGADCVLAKPLRIAQLDAVLKYVHVHGFTSSPVSKLSMISDLDAENSYTLREI